MAFADESDSLKIEADKKLFAQAVEYSLDKNWSQAELIYRHLLERHNHWPELGNNLALLLLQTNRINEAEKVFEQALNSLPSIKTTLHNRSRLYQYLASRAYDRALGTQKQIELPSFTLIHSIYPANDTVEQGVLESEYADDSY